MMAAVYSAASKGWRQVSGSRAPRLRVPMTENTNNAIFAASLTDSNKDAISRKAVPLLDVEAYQDGTTSPQTLQLLQAICAEIKPVNPPHS